jgi:hypothetical protein
MMMSEISKETQAKFDQGVVESIWSENGELSYVIKDGLNIEEYAIVIKEVLESQKEIAHDFAGTVTNESRTAFAKFEYKSGWFLEGLADGEIE